MKIIYNWDALFDTHSYTVKRVLDEDTDGYVIYDDFLNVSVSVEKRHIFYPPIEDYIIHSYGTKDHDYLEALSHDWRGEGHCQDLYDYLSQRYDKEFEKNNKEQTKKFAFREDSFDKAIEKLREEGVISE